MRITVIGRGNVGGGLGKLWREAGHEVTELGRDGGDASDADVLLVAVPGSSIADAVDKVSASKESRRSTPRTSSALATRSTSRSPTR